MRTLIAIILSLILFNIANSRNVVIGDSISAGAFSEYDHKKNLVAQAQNVALISELLKFPFFKEQAVNNKRHSWFTYLMKMMNEEGINNAKSSATINQLDAQLNFLRADRIFIMAGSNNICFNESYNGLDRLIRKAKTKSDNVYIFDVPNLSLLKKNFSKYSSCKTVWNTLKPYCEHVLNKNSPLSRLRNSFLNDHIENMAKKHNINYMPIFKNEKHDIENMSFDCFHPNKRGQKLIANKIYKMLQ